MRNRIFRILIFTVCIWAAGMPAPLRTQIHTGEAVAAERNHTKDTSQLRLNKKQFTAGERLLLQFNNATDLPKGPWDVYLSLATHIDKTVGNKPITRRFLPQWTATKKPAKKNVILKQGVMDIIDIVVEENLPVGHHQLKLHLQPSNKAAQPVTFRTDFHILPSPASVPPVIVDIKTAGRPVKSLTGFLHGLSPKKHRKQLSDKELKPLIQNLQPSFWRLNNNYIYRAARKSKAAVTFVLGDLLIQEGLKPWKTNKKDRKARQKIEKAIREKLRWARAAGIQPDYWDLWNEPDTKQSWGGTTDQFLDYIQLVVPIIREEYPQAKIVAPSTADNYARIPEFWEKFISFLRKNEIHIDALSWHEFHRPEDIPQTAAKIREATKKIPWLKEAELHVNEYGGGQNHLIPGWQLGWLYYLDAADIDWANHACWYWPRGKGRENVSECVRGLNGLLHPLTLEPLPAYWVNLWQGQMSGNRLSIDTPTPRIVALGSYDKETAQLQVILGRFSCGLSLKWCRFHGSQIQDEFLPAKPLTVVFENLPTHVSSVYAKISKVTGDKNQEPLLAPEEAGEKILRVLDGTASLKLKQFRDGEVYHVAVSTKPFS